MNSSSIILSTSDWIQLLGIIASLVTSIIAIFISIFTLRQNSKMIEASSRPVLSIYGESINPGYPMFYIVVKNFGSSPALITQFDYDFDFSSAYCAYKGKDFLKQLQNSVIAPGQSRICALKSSALTQPVTFELTYSSDFKTYHEKLTVDLKAGADMLISKNSTEGKELRTISYALQEMLQKKSLIYFSYYRSISCTLLCSIQYFNCFISC